ncbi:TadE family type IV pilus minor pilin [Microlunatus capsulatus]|uniref:TadE-like protein n=1 Tax=Microlunatus capsulatus TaxID=99117 RepID=A0ABS4Z9F4_9ACTN|nr:TadE family type IV pilus minor pilin [Microlunatus capsulatus]MBP2417599.1 hypothetical protein [Microlunatus capsulatus]
MVPARGVTRSRGGRGMVTAELAVAILAALSLFLLLCWGVLLVVMQLRCVDTAAAVARQEARGDREASAVVRAQAPDGARVQVQRRSGQVVVRVEVTVAPLRGGRLAVPLSAEAVVVPEPGGTGR